jgi:hypothetical protein
MIIKNEKIGKIILLTGVVLITLLALLPAKHMVLRVISQGFYGHFLAFLFLSSLAFICSTMNVFKQMFSLLLVGIMIEVAQYFSGYRSASFEDLCFDMYGVLSFYSLYGIYLLYRKLTTGTFK